MKSFVVLLAMTAVVALFVPPSAPAQYFMPSSPDAGPYFRVGGGPAFAQDGELSRFAGAATTHALTYRTGANFEGAVGYAFNRNFAAEAEFGWIANQIESAQGFAMNDTFVHQVPLLVNLRLQCPIPGTMVTPYLGAGAGCSSIIFDTDGFSDGTFTLVGRESDVVFAYQFFAGLRFDLNERMSLGVGYRYFATEDSRFNYGSFFAGGPKIGFNLGDTRTHLVSVTFNMKF